MLVRLLKRILVVTRVFDGRLTGLNCVGQEQCVIRSKLLQYCGLPYIDALHFIHPFVSFPTAIEVQSGSQYPGINRF